MIDEIFVALTPKEAYEEAVKKYSKEIKLVCAKQVKYSDGNIYAEVTIAVSQELFEKNIGFQKEEDKNTEVTLELESLKKEVARLKKKSLKKRSIERKIESLFMRQGIAKEWLEKSFKEMRDKEINTKDEIALVSYLLEKIDRRLTTVSEDLRSPKIMMFVGATGVGKTTTVAKLAARYAYLSDVSYKVALVNLDNYKVGAHEQLGHYAKVMDIEHIILKSVDAYEEKLMQLNTYDMVLIDTAGMSPFDTQKFINIIEFLEAKTEKKVEVNLVIPATIKYEDMRTIYHHFSFLNLDTVIISKFDETKEFGTLLNFMLMYDIPMSYFTTGQEVPNDLQLASKEYLLEKFIGDLDGFTS